MCSSDLWADEPSPGNLRLSVNGILTRFIATYAGIITSDSSSLPYDRPSSYYGTLSYQLNAKSYIQFRSFGSQLSPDHFRRRVA